MGGGVGSGTLSTSGKSGTKRRAPCGITDNRDSCRQLSSNLFTVLLQSKQFKRIYNKIKIFGVTITVNPTLSLKVSAGSNSPPAGEYDLIRATITVPTTVYRNKKHIKSVNMLTVIAHEFYHAYQFEDILKLSKCKSPQERAKLYAEYVKKIGRDKFIKINLKREKDAEKFAQGVVLQALKEKHSGLITYREMFGPKVSTKKYYNFIISTWWYANEGKYKDDAEVEWVQWTYRYEKKDYEPEFNKKEMLKWLKQHPEVKKGIPPK